MKQPVRSSLALLLLAACAAGCSATPEPRDEHREVVLATRGADEAYDILLQCLLQRFDAVDPGGTDRTHRIVLTTWRVSEEPDRLVRRRARGDVRWLTDAEKAVVHVSVSRELSTRKTSFGDLDRESPHWVGGSDVADSTLEAEILNAVKARHRGDR